MTLKKSGWKNIFEKSIFEIFRFWKFSIFENFSEYFWKQFTIENPNFQNFQEQKFEVSFFLPKTADNAGTPSFKGGPEKSFLRIVWNIYMIDSI